MLFIEKEKALNKHGILCCFDTCCKNLRSFEGEFIILFRF